MTQLRNKNIACSYADGTLRIIKIKNKNGYEDIQLIKKAHSTYITTIIELKNGNIITFSLDSSFKIWKLNNNNQYEKNYEFKDTNKLSDGLEIKDNEIILYSIATSPSSLAFYNLNQNAKIKTLNNLHLFINDLGKRIIRINNDKIALAGSGSIYLIDILNYLILNEIKSDAANLCILKISNNLFLTGESNGGITQYRIVNRKLIKESFKNKSHEERIYSLVKINDMIISGSDKNQEIKIWKI